jgi:prolipoprotein diacylglyceryltransferase
MSEYNFSLFGAIFWFLIVLFTLSRLEKTPLSRYIDGVVLAFLCALCIGYIGSIFWWQVIGRETQLGIEINYVNPNPLVPYEVPLFPLPIIYSIISFLLFSWMYILSLFVHIRWCIGYLGLLLFSSMILVFEFFSGKQDILSVVSVFNLPQVFALILAAWSWYQLYKIFQKDLSTKEKTISI